MPDQYSKASRVSIKLGGTSALPAANGKRHRAHALHNDSHSEGDDDNDGASSQGEEQRTVHIESITSFEISGGGRESWPRERHQQSRSERESGQTRGRNSDAAQQTKDARGAGRRQDTGGAEDGLDFQDKAPTKWGLTINMKSAGSSKVKKEAGLPSDDSDSKADDEKRSREAPQNVDDEALEALMGNKAPKRRRDSNDADREPRPDDYRSVPIDDFGATLLRGFGWDGKLRGKVKEVVKHANLTGLGASNGKGAEDLGAWDQKTTKDSRPARLEDYQREDRKKRQRLDDQNRDSYKREREREREHERERRHGHGRDR
ncbi:hypothetical protein B0T26DRAFT_740085 [Lasiosphaeria miniovina]|uniref:Spp2/MOS2 G-patch domain-containing protein n=1 Tax=Lasiosphaeria miniovina TaxID=1954250 RepID=A0AA40AW45_9PEZI|nr:uncharacterized protein B0T26DRAFT_740085 [Lasiosphaeria miniovina]KAK0723038.1 hypothetical protein B0T26DRAFT_740085 [Lasiosphaeria miniovina]